MVEGGSSVPRRQLGRYLKKAREEAGISLEAAATELEWSRARMYRIEGGQTVVRTHDAVAMCKLYGVPEDMTSVLVDLARQSKARGWWHSYGDAVPGWFSLYVSMEAAACRLRSYEPGLIPGLLQTREYAEAILRLRAGATERQVAEGVTVRMERQQLLTRRQPAAPSLSVILDEAVLRRSIGDGQAMRQQLAHLINASRSPTVSVRVLASRVGPHQGCETGAFTILDFAGIGRSEPEPTTVYCQSVTGALYLDKPEEVDTYSDVWERLDAQALGRQESEEFITTIIKESTDA